MIKLSSLFLSLSEELISDGCLGLLLDNDNLFEVLEKYFFEVEIDSLLFSSLFSEIFCEFGVLLNPIFIIFDLFSEVVDEIILVHAFDDALNGKFLVVLCIELFVQTLELSLNLDQLL